MKMKLTREDILSGKVIPPAWYRCRVKSVNQEQAKSDGSTNYVFQFVVNEGPYKDTPLKKWYVNEKAPGVATGFIEIMTGKEVQPDVEYDLETSVGKIIDVKVKNTEFNGRMGNDVDGFRKAS